MQALITGVGSGVGQSVIKSLRMSGLDIQIVGVDMTPFNAGLYACDKGYLVPRADSPEYGERLLQIIDKEKIDILFPGTDTELPYLADMKDTFEQLGCKSVIGSAESIRVVRNKMECAAFFRERGFPFVPTVYVRDIKLLHDRIGFPIIVKPTGGSGSSGVSVITKLEELGVFEEEQEEFIAQQFLVPQSWNKRPEEVTLHDIYKGGLLNQQDEISIQIVLGRNAEVLGVFMSKNELKAGFPMKVVPFRDDDLEDLGVKMALVLAHIGLVGPCNLQCRMTEDGPVFFEINTRFTGITGMRAAMGFNECEAMVKRLVLEEDEQTVRKSLQYEDGWLCARYVTEVMMRKADVEQLGISGETEAKGKALSL
ncbi:ATP-grasp domain-containing protein [Effusibacillus lacus]|uniref:ATP-grasp domain-containing protein n=1 Tax=Effusibacillus lacus TaxID=1348429 RepID=A0A292YKF2_9BACL|nr:ATP-grasp domain-containing protein [Effusibacillus lacus]TCS70812.1 carbamoyl-phosphate synthase large subunit [Effusibacillus lacus]GAX89391.1 hypothetical protein EFBL_1009 [Effusibacillus lacus]